VNKLSLGLWLIMLMPAIALAADAEADALSLADQALTPVAKASDWHVFVEGAVGETTLRNGATLLNQRLL
jgi:hypothetical protein